MTECKSYVGKWCVSGDNYCFPRILRSVWSGVGGWSLRVSNIFAASRQQFSEHASPWQHYGTRVLAPQHQRVHAGLQHSDGGTVSILSMKTCIKFVIAPHQLLCVWQNKLSGNLLRKFKNSNGWQKLWVVFTNFTLFFYKTHEVKHQHAHSLCECEKYLDWRSFLSVRTSFLWPVCRCWVTPSQMLQNQKTSIKITSSNCTSNLMSTSSELRVSTFSKGTAKFIILPRNIVNPVKPYKCIGLVRLYFTVSVFNMYFLE